MTQKITWLKNLQKTNKQQCEALKKCRFVGSYQGANLSFLVRATNDNFFLCSL